MEKDSGAETEDAVTRSSVAMINKDSRGKKHTIHKDSEDEEDPMFYPLCPSWMGQVFQVQYSLKVYLKHDSFFERG